MKEKKPNKKLIEVSIPLVSINRACKNIKTRRNKTPAFGSSRCKIFGNFAKIE